MILLILPVVIPQQEHRQQMLSPWFSNQKNTYWKEDLIGNLILTNRAVRLITESAESSEEKHLRKQGTIQEGPGLEHQGLLGDLWDIRSEGHRVSDSGALKLHCIAGNRRHKDGRRPGNDDTVDRTSSTEDTE
jgi:hypothetical protein